MSISPSIMNAAWFLYGAVLIELAGFMFRGSDTYNAISTTLVAASRARISVFDASRFIFVGGSGMSGEADCFIFGSEKSSVFSRQLIWHCPLSPHIP